MAGITTRPYWTGQPYKWHVDDGEESCNVLDKPERPEQGRLGWQIDPEGNKVELREPPDRVRSTYPACPGKFPDARHVA